MEMVVKIKTKWVVVLRREFPIRKFKIAVVADLHIVPENVLKLNSKIGQEAPDILVFAGDILDTSNENLFLEFLKTFADLPQPKLLTLGNHDLWQEEKPNTQALYEYYLQFPWENYGFHLLDKEPFVYRNLTFCGNLGWYDYSLRLSHAFDVPVIANDDLLRWEEMGNEEIRHLLETAARKSFQDLDESDFARKILLIQNNGPWESLHWYDRLYINWGKSDREVTNYFLTRLEEQLQQTKGLKQVVVLHHAPILQRTETESVPDAYLSAFSGSRRFWELIRDFGVKTAIHGHLHRRERFSYRGVNIYSCYGNPFTIEI